MTLSCTVSELLSFTKSLTLQDIKNHVTLNTPVWGKSIMHTLVFLPANQHTTFEVPSFTDFKDMIGGQF